MAKLSFRNPFNFSRRRSQDQIAQQVINKFNEAFFWGSLGGEVTNDDYNFRNYIELAYNINPDVYSVVNQIANKFTSVPYCVRDIKDMNSAKQLQILNKATNYDYSVAQEFKAIKLKDESYEEKIKDLPLEVPNPNQTWQQFWALSETFLSVTGNCYWYVQTPELRQNADPIAIYVMPAHLMEIVVKSDTDLISNENVIDHYCLLEGNSYVDFKSEEIVHIKYANPNFDQNGQHLYGQSPLRAAYKNVIATNKGLDLSVNTMKNGGAFGFIHAKDNQTPLTTDQAISIKDRLKEMNKNAEDLSRISAISQAIGFTRLSLTPDELKPFDYFKYNLKQVCNVFGWDDKLVNSDDGAKYDNMKIAEKRVVTSKIVPDIKLFAQSFDKYFLQKFKGYDNSCIDFMVKELPEMQQDYKTMVEWIEKAVQIGLITRNQGLQSMGMPTSDNEYMDVYTVRDDVMTLEDAIIPQPGLTIRE